MADFAYPPIDFEVPTPGTYTHWNVRYDGPVATVTMDVQDEKGMWPGRYELKLNSYDLSVDIELHDIVERMRFEHPEVKVVMVTGPEGQKVFCAGANIRMLGQSPHAFKVNFCKYTNETRVGLEEACESSGQTWVAALNGTASGGGYELALACKYIWLIEDGNAAVSLPEVPLLGVLPGTGGLTRITDKRKIRRDVADIFCTKAEGFRAKEAVKFKLVDRGFSRSQWAEGTTKAAQELAQKAPAKVGGPGLAIPKLERTATEKGWSYPYVAVEVVGRVATLVLKGPASADCPRSVANWSFQAFREFEDALLRLRFNHLDVGLVVLKTVGDKGALLAHEKALAEAAKTDWWFEEVRLFVHRTLRRWDNMAKSLFAVVEPGSCFAGTLLELAFAADRTYMLADADNTIQLSDANAGRYPMASGMSRLTARFLGEDGAPDRLLHDRNPIDGEEAEARGLVTAAPDDIDWEDEVRIAIEERISLSPDALTGMEQNLRFGGAETCETKIYGRLSAWQNWIFQRPNAVGERGALTMFGNPERPIFDFRRT